MSLAGCLTGGAGNTNPGAITQSMSWLCHASMMLFFMESKRAKLCQSSLVLKNENDFLKQCQKSEIPILILHLLQTSQGRNIIHEFRKWTHRPFEKRPSNPHRSLVNDVVHLNSLENKHLINILGNTLSTLTWSRISPSHRARLLAPASARMWFKNMVIILPMFGGLEQN